MAASQSLGTMTASTCAPEKAHGTHLFKIDGYSLYRGLGVGECINSATFAVGGHDWCLCVYPDGENEEFEDWVSVYVELKTKNTEVRALYDLRIVDRTTRPPQPVYTPPNPSGIEPSVFDTLDGEMSACGHTDFLRKSEIDKYLMDDVLLIECSLTVIKFKEAIMNAVAVQKVKCSSKNHFAAKRLRTIAAGLTPEERAVIEGNSAFGALLNISHFIIPNELIDYAVQHTTPGLREFKVGKKKIVFTTDMITKVFGIRSGPKPVVLLKRSEHHALRDVYRGTSPRPDIPTAIKVLTKCLDIDEDTVIRS
ncbi:hypothetical protein ACQ4PT_001111 [Festuca glaucescens]